MSRTGLVPRQTILQRLAPAPSRERPLAPDHVDPHHLRPPPAARAGRVCPRALAAIDDADRPPRAAARHARVLLAHGRVERKGRVVHVIARRLESLDATLDTPEVRRREYR